MNAVIVRSSKVETVAIACLTRVALEKSTVLFSLSALDREGHAAGNVRGADTVCIA